MQSSNRGRVTKITPNSQLLLALDRATTGANAHDVGEFRERYHIACDKGLQNLVSKWEAAFNAFLSGRITPLRKAVAELRFDSKPPLYGNKNWWNEGE